MPGQKCQGMSPGRSVFESESIRMLILRTAIPYSMAMSAMNYGMETRVIRAKLLSDSSRLLICHYALQRLQDEVRQICVIRKVLCAIVSWYPGSLAQEFVVRWLVWISKASPPANVINKNCPIAAFSRDHSLK